MTTLLIVLTASRAWTLADGTQHPTGFWAEELVTPHRVFSDAGWEITVATPGGAVPGVDEASLDLQVNGGDARIVDALRAGLRNLEPVLRRPATLEDVDVDAFDVVFVPGGHGPMEDLAASPAMGALLVRALDAGTPIGALCHGVAALLPAVRDDGSWAFAGYELSAFSDAEEEAVGLADRAAWLLERRLRERGAAMSVGGLWAPHLVSDRTVHTGQNPASSGPLAERLVAILAGEEPPALDAPAPLTGRCLCGESTYVASSAPLVTAICHCTDCQRQSGSAYSLVVAVPRDTVELQGASIATVVTTTAATGTPSYRKFCSRCGSPLVVLADASPELAFIKAGTLDDRTALRPAIEVHCDDAIAYTTDGETERTRFPAGLPA